MFIRIIFGLIVYGLYRENKELRGELSGMKADAIDRRWTKKKAAEMMAEIDVLNKRIETTANPDVREELLVQVNGLMKQLIAWQDNAL